MKEYVILKVNSIPDWNAVPVLAVDTILWEPDCGIRMTQQLCYDETALYVRQRAWEANIRAEYSAPLSPVHEDSCMEFFFAFGADERYFNFEINPDAKIVCEAERLRPEKSEVNRLLGDSTKLRELTGWAPQYTFEQGLAATIEFLRGNLDQYKVGQYIL